MSRRSTDRDYCQELWRRFYIAGGYGNYETAWQRFEEEHPEAVSVLERLAKQQAITSLRAEFAAGDRDEGTDEDDETPFPPPHLRQAFLELFDVELPPLSASIDGGPDGRIAREQATLQQHHEANGRIREYHRRGLRYRDHINEKLEDIRDHVLDNDERWSQLSLFDLCALVTKE